MKLNKNSISAVFYQRKVSFATVFIYLLIEESKIIQYINNQSNLHFNYK